MLSFLIATAICGGCRVQAVQQVVQPVYSYAYPYAEQLRFVADPYYANVVAEQVRQEKLRSTEKLETANLEQRIAELSNSVLELQKSIAGNAWKPPTGTAPAPPEPPANENTDPLPSPEPVPAGDTGLSPPTAEAMAVITAKCASCHTQGREKDNTFAMVDADGNPLDMTASQRLRIDMKTYSGKMPPSAPLDNGEYQTLRNWINQDADAIARALKTCP